MANRAFGLFAVKVGCIWRCMMIRPLEITMMIDNFVSNSIKAESTKLEFVIKKRSGTLFIDIIDNGIGIEENIKDKLFEFGKSTTNGSGIGLYHIKDIVEKLDGTIELSQENSLFGAEFNIRINI